MLVLALDTTTRQGSVALARDAVLLGCEVGDDRLTHGERLPGDLIRLLERNNTRLSDIDLFAVAAGPGSFTGLRIGIATMQGLALTNGRGLVGVSALDALNAVGKRGPGSLFSGALGEKRDPGPLFQPGPFFVGALMDAQRGEVFSALYCDDELIEGPAVEAPAGAVARWKNRGTESITLAGNGALTYRDLIARILPAAQVVTDVPPLAPSIAMIAQQQASGGARSPGAIRPIYVRRPDAELARDRKGQVHGSGSVVQGSGPKV